MKGPSASSTESAPRTGGERREHPWGYDPVHKINPTSPCRPT